MSASKRARRARRQRLSKPLTFKQARRIARWFAARLRRRPVTLDLGSCLLHSIRRPA